MNIVVIGSGQICSNKLKKSIEAGVMSHEGENSCWRQGHRHTTESELYKGEAFMKAWRQAPPASQLLSTNREV